MSKKSKVEPILTAGQLRKLKKLVNLKYKPMADVYRQLSDMMSERKNYTLNQQKFALNFFLTDLINSGYHLEGEQKIRKLFDMIFNKKNLEKYPDLLNTSLHPNLQANPPLHTAVKMGATEMVRQLLALGADPNFKNYNGETAFDVVKRIDWFLKGEIEPLLTKAADSQVNLEGLDEESESQEHTGEEDEKLSEPLSQAVLSIFNDGKFHIKPTYHQFHLYQCEAMLEARDLRRKLRRQWSAFHKTRINFNGLEMIHTFLGEELDKDGFDINLDTKSLTNGVKAALQNLIAYSGQLMAEANPGDRGEALLEKIEAAGNFLRAVLSQEDLTTDTLRAAYEKLERADQNRGSGFYRLHTFFTGKRYTDAKGHSRLVKSTLGELAHDLFKAVERAEKDKEYEAEVSVDSSSFDSK